LHTPTVLAFLAFNSAAGALALTPNLGLWEDVATVLHVAVAAFNMAVLRRCFESLAGPVIILAAGMLAVEGLQTMIPGRSGSFDDIAADLFGLSIGLVVASLRLGRKPRRRRPVAATQGAAPLGWASGPRSA
jgi:hypothetical protein